MAVDDAGWSMMLMLSTLGVIPLVLISFFVAAYLSNVRQRRKEMKQQIGVKPPIHRIEIEGNDKEISMAGSTQSTQKYVESATVVTEEEHRGDLQTDTNGSVISKEEKSQSRKVALQKDEKIPVQPAVQPKNLSFSTISEIPKTSSVSVSAKEKDKEKVVVESQVTYPVTSAPIIVNSTVRSKASSKDISGSMSMVLDDLSRKQIPPHLASQPILSNSSPSRNSLVDNSDVYTEFTIPEFTSRISKSLITDEC